MKQQRINADDLWTRARWPRPDEQLKVGQPYIFTENPRRGMRTVSVLQSDGRQAFFDIQRIPDSFFDECQRTRDMWDGMSSVKRNAIGFTPLIEIPDSIATVLYSKERDGRKQLDPLDPEREKRKRQFINDSDYKKLRLSSGTI